jgi:hypothetical protein
MLTNEGTYIITVPCENTGWCENCTCLLDESFTLLTAVVHITYHKYHCSACSQFQSKALNWFIDSSKVGGYPDIAPNLAALFAYLSGAHHSRVSMPCSGTTELDDMQYNITKMRY